MNSCLVKMSKHPEFKQDALIKISNAETQELLIDVVKGLYLTNLNGDIIQIDDLLFLLQRVINRSKKPEKISQLLFVKNNLQSLVTNHRLKIIHDENASLDFVTPNNFIPIISHRLNSILYNQTAIEPINVLVYNPTIGLISPNILDGALINYKNQLFGIIERYLKSQDILALYRLDGSYNYPLYRNIMNLAWEEIKRTVGTNNTYDAPQNIKTEQFLNFVKAFYILNNFDDFITKMSNGIIRNKTSFDSIDTMQVKNKYEHTKSSKEASSYNGDYADSDPDKQFGKIFFALWQTISNGNGGTLTKYDYNSLVKNIKVALNEGKTSSDSFDYSFLIDHNLKRDEFCERLISALRYDAVLHSRMGVHGKEMCEEIAKFLETFNKHYINKSNSKLISILDARDLSIKLDFITQFQSELMNRDNIEYLSVDENEDLQTKSAARITVSKEPIIKVLQERLLDNMLHGKFSPYKIEILTNAAGSYIYSEKFLNTISEITGLNLSRQNLDKFFNNKENITTLFEFLNSWISGVNSEVISQVKKLDIGDKEAIQEVVSNFIKKTRKTNGSYVGFTNILISENKNDVIKIIDQESNPQPISTMPTTGGKVADNIKSFAENFKKWSKDNHNILVKYPGLISDENRYKDKLSNTGYIEHTAYRQDAVFIDEKGRKRSIKAVEMNPHESLYVAFNHEFFNSILLNYVFYNLTACYADKTRIMLHAFNLTGHVVIDLGGVNITKRLIECSASEVQQLWRKQHDSYYTALYNKLLSDYKKIFNLNDSVTLLDCIRELEKVDEATFLRKVKDYNNTHLDKIIITGLIHYINTDSGLRFNNTLYAHLTDLDNYVYNYYDDGFKSLKEELKKIIIPKKFRTEKFITNNLVVLANLFDLDIYGGINENGTYTKNEEAENNAIELLKGYFKVDSNEDVSWIHDDDFGLSETIASKYYALQTLTTDAELQITSKFNTLHKGLKNQYSIDELTSESISSDTKFNHIKEDESVRLTVNTKRNNAFVASYLPMITNNKYGVRSRAKIAVVESKKQMLFTPNGNSDKMAVNDGALWTLGIAVRWENASYPGKIYADTKKVIGLIPTFEGFNQYKCADYALDNLLLLDRFRTSDPLFLDLYTRARKMMELGLFSDDFYSAFTNTKRRNIGYDLYRRLNDGKMYKLNKITCTNKDEHLFTFEWLNVETSENKVSTPVRIDNVFQLWEEFGAENSKEFEDGKFIDSNVSMNLIADLISEYDDSVKETIVSKIVDVECNKEGIQNLNLLSDVDNPEKGGLNTIYIDCSRWGIQQDYSHESEESEIPSLTQVISAIAFNGKNIKLVEDMNETLSRITLNLFEENNINYNGTSEQKFNFHKKLTKRFLASISENSITDAQQIAMKVIQEMISGDKNVQMPYSNPTIFYKLASNFISSLNKDSIRQRFKGIAIVQNPSHSIIGLYEDSKGKVYTAIDLIERKRREYLKNNIEPLKSDNELLKEALTDAEFLDIDITNLGLAAIDMEDHVKIVGQSIDGTENIIAEYYITDPKQFDEIEGLLQNKTYTLKKVFTKQRNLAGPKIKFITKDGVLRSFWSMNSTRELARINTKIINTEKRIKELQKRIPSTLNEIQQALIELRNLKVDKLDIFRWHRANIEGLGDTNIKYFYPTIEAFRSGKEETILNAELIEGELILPKEYESVFGIKGISLAEVMELGYEFFKPQAEKRLKSSKTFDFTNENLRNSAEFMLTAVRDSDELVYLGSNDISNIGGSSNNNIEENGVVYYRENGVNLFSVPSLTSKVSVRTLSNGKKLYVIWDIASVSKFKTALYSTKDINALYHPLKSLNDPYKLEFSSVLHKVNKIINTDTERIDELIIRYAHQMFDSFKLQNETISARIPSQHFLSFMTNKTVAFTRKGVNDGYINIYEAWFQGSDYDIDKAYTMMYAVNKNGLIETTSPLSIFTNKHTLDKSFELPLPNKNLIISKGDTDTVSRGLLKTLLDYSIDYNNISDAYKYLKSLRDSNTESDLILYLTVVKSLLETLQELLLTTPLICSETSGLIQMLNKHNNFEPTIEGLKNKVVNTIKYCASDIKNFEASTQPMSSKYINDLIDEVLMENKSKTPLYNVLNPFSKFLIQYENSVGKKNVGIAANGVKAASSLLQYFNKFYSGWDGNTELDKSYLFDMNIDISVGDRNIVTHRYKTIGDVVLDTHEGKALYKFKQLYKDVSVEDLTKFTDYHVITYLQQNGEFKRSDSILGNSFYLPNGKLKSQFEEAYNIWELFKRDFPSLDPIRNRDDFLTYLYYKSKFAHNVADSLSVFISLATDNAKELALAKINANPQLMGLPLAMLTMGMEPKHVIDICVNVLQPIADKMKGNRFQESVSTNVRALIESEPSYNDSTRESMLAIFDFALELRAITSFFKVNQGLSAQYYELLQFIKNLSAVKTQVETRKHIRPTKDYLTGILDLDKFISNSSIDTVDGKLNYADTLINYFNDIKTGVNVLNVVKTNKNFFSMLKAMNQQTNVLKHVAAAAKFVDTQSTVDSDANMKDFSKLILVYLHFIVGKTLDKITKNYNFRFTNNDLKRELNVSDTSLTIADNVPFGLDTNYGIKSFIDVIENVVIPLLKAKYGNNFFVKALNEEYDRNLDRNVFGLGFNIFNDEDINEQQNIQNALLAFKDLNYRYSGIKTIDGRALSIGDVFYLYDLIINKGRMSSLNTVITTAENDVNSFIGKLLNDTYVHYDKLAFNEDPSLDEEFNTTKLIQKAILSKDFSASENNVSINLKNEYIWTKVVPVARISCESLLENLNVKNAELIKTNSNQLVKVRIPTNYGLNILFNVEVLNASSINDLSDVYLNTESIEQLTTLIRQHSLNPDELYGINANQRIKISNLKGNLSSEIKSILKPLDINKIGLYVKYTQSDSQIGISRNGYVLKITDVPQIVVNSDILSKPNGELELLDLYIESQLDVVSQDAKLSKFKELIQSLDTPTQKSLYNKYIEYLSNHYPEQDKIKAGIEIYSMLNNFILNKEIFYRTAQEFEKRSFILSNELNEGDIITISDSAYILSSDEYIYLGIVDGLKLCISLNGDNLYIITNDNILLKYRLKVPTNFYSPNPRNKTTNKSWEDYKLKTIHQLKTGDRILLQTGLEYNISLIIYDMNNNGLYIPQILGYDDNNTLYLISDLREIKKFKASDPDLLLGNVPISIIEISENYAETKQFIKNLSKGDKVWITPRDSSVATEVIFNQFVSRDKFLSENGIQYDIDDISKIQLIGNYNPDIEFDNNSLELSIDRTSKYNSKKISSWIYSIGARFNAKPINNFNGSYNLNNAELITYIDQNGNTVYNLSGYEKITSNIDPVEGDIFIERKKGGDIIYKIITKGINGVSLVYTKSSKGFECKLINEYTLSNFEHFSKNRQSILQDFSKPDPNAVEITGEELSEIKAGAKILEFLQDRFGTKIMRRNLPQTAMFENNIIYISDKLNIEDVANESIHEFTHLALAYMRMTNRDGYITFISNFEQMLNSATLDTQLKSIFNEVDNLSEYESRLDRIEEKIVRYLDYLRHKNKMFEAEEDFIKFMNQSFLNLFNLNGFVYNDRPESLKYILNKYSDGFFTEVIENLDFLALKRDTINKKMLNHIKEYCL